MMSTESPLLDAARRGDLSAAEAIGWKLLWEDHPPAYELGLCIFWAAARGHAEFLRSLLKNGKEQLADTPGSGDGYRDALDVALGYAAEEADSKILELLFTQIEMPRSVDGAELLLLNAAGYGRLRNLQILLKHVSGAHLARCCREGALEALRSGYLKTSLYLVNALAESGAFADRQAAWQALDREDHHGCLHRAVSPRRLHVLRWALAQGFPNRNDVLAEAASKKWPEGVRLLLDSGVDPKEPASEALVFAARDNSPEIARLLIDAGINTRTPGEKSVFGLPPLLQAAGSGSLGVIQVLLDAQGVQAPLPAQLEDALQLATGSGHVEAVERLRRALGMVGVSESLDVKLLVAAARSGDPELWAEAARKGLQTDARDDYGCTPLHGAASSGNPDIVRALLEAGASPHARNNLQQTPLHQLARSRSSRDRRSGWNPAEVIRLLLDRGADIDALDGARRTPLADALWGGTAEVVALLLEAGADVMGKWNSADPKAPDMTPLHVAVIQADAETISLLASAGADVNAADSGGWTPLHWAARGDVDHENVGALLRSGADPGRKDTSGTTPLHIAVRDGRMDAVEQLLAYGADANAQDENGNTPLLTLCISRLRAWNAGRIAAMLLAAGADPHHRNRRNLTALEYAEKHKQELKDVRRLLKKSTPGKEP